MFLLQGISFPGLLTRENISLALLQGRHKTSARRTRAYFADKRLFFDTESAPPLHMPSLQTCHNFPVAKVHLVNSTPVDFGRKFIKTKW